MNKNEQEKAKKAISSCRNEIYDFINDILTKKYGDLSIITSFGELFLGFIASMKEEDKDFKDHFINQTTKKLNDIKKN